MVGIDQIGQRGLPDPGGQRQRGDGHPRADPERRVAGEQQVGQRVDDEVTAVVHAAHQGELGGGERQFVEGHACHQQVGQRRRFECAQVRRKLLSQWNTESAGVDGGGYAVHPRRTGGQRLGQEIAQQQHLHPAGGEQRRERVVLLLGLGDPGQSVEQQGVVVARGESLQLRAGTVQDHRPQPADLRIGSQRYRFHAQNVNSTMVEVYGDT